MPDKHFETPKGKSLTILGEAYTIEELMKKHTLGQMPNVERTVYDLENDHDSVTFEEIKTMDMAEADELKIINSQKINDLKEKIKSEKKPKESKPLDNTNSVEKTD